MLKYAWLVLSLSFVCGSSPALAEGHRVGLDLAFHTQKNLTVLGALLEGELQVADSIVIGARVPLATGFVDVAFFGSEFAGFKAELGNPELGVAYQRRSDSLVYSVGGALTLPVATTDASSPSDVAETLAEAIVRSAVAGTYGLRDSWLWGVDFFSIVAPMKLEYRSEAHLLVVADAALALMIPLRDRADNPSTSSTDVALQARAGVGYASESLDAGVALGVAAVPTQDDANADVAQTALEPFVKARFGDGYVESRLTVNLDHPLGFAFDEDRIWGLHVGAGALF